MENKQIDWSIIGKNIHQLRAGSRLSQKQIANEIQVDISSIISWEKGKRVPSLKNVLALCNYFNVRVDDLIGISNVRK